MAVKKIDPKFDELVNGIDLAILERSAGHTVTQERPVYIIFDKKANRPVILYGKIVYLKQWEADGQLKGLADLIFCTLWAAGYSRGGPYDNHMYRYKYIQYFVKKTYKSTQNISSLPYDEIEKILSDLSNNPDFLDDPSKRKLVTKFRKAIRERFEVRTCPVDVMLPEIIRQIKSGYAL